MKAKSTHTAAYRRLLSALKLARRRAGLTQLQAARRLGRYQSFVSKVETGERRLDVVELSLICKAYRQDLIRFIWSLEL